MKADIKKYDSVCDNYVKKVAGNLQVFLDIFGLHLGSNDNYHSYVLTKNNTKLGKAAFTRLNGIDVNFSCRNGVVKVNTLTLSANDCCIHFHIQNSPIQSQTGYIRTTKIGVVDGENIFGFNGLNLTTYVNGKRISNIQICDEEKYFHYYNYLTNQRVSFSAISATGGIGFGAERKNETNSHHICIQATIDNDKISKIDVYDRREDLFIPTERIMKQINSEDSIWQQMDSAITLVYPEVYQDVSRIIDSYDNKGINLIKKSIESVCYDEINDWAVGCCVGKELMKKLSSEKYN